MSGNGNGSWLNEEIRMVELVENKPAASTAAVLRVGNGLMNVASHVQVDKVVGLQAGIVSRMALVATKVQKLQLSVEAALKVRVERCGSQAESALQLFLTGHLNE